MPFSHKEWNTKFLDHLHKHDEPYHDSKKFDVKIIPAGGLSEGENYWRCIGVHHLSGDENRSNHNIYVDVLDEECNRMQRTMLRYHQQHQRPILKRLDKPDYEAGSDFPIHGAEPVEMRIEDLGLKTDKVTGLRINLPDEDRYNTIGHHSFYIVWKRSKYENAHSRPNPTPKPTPERPKPERPTPIHNPPVKEPTNLISDLALAKAKTNLYWNRRFNVTAEKNNLGQAVSTYFNFVVSGRVFIGQAFEQGVVFVNAVRINDINAYRIARNNFA